MATKDIRIHRYQNGQIVIEPKDASWMIGLNKDGKPAIYWAEREPCGAVVGDGVRL